MSKASVEAALARGGIEGAALKRAPRVRLFNLRTQEGFAIQFNPTQFEERVAVNYARPPVLGHSHQELQYLNTNNLQVPMQFFFLSRDIASHEVVQDAKAFFYSLVYPVNEPGSIVGSAPPRCLLVWPKVLSLTAKVTQLSIKNQRFNSDGEVVQLLIDCQFEEMRNVRYTSNAARVNGSRRSGENPGGAQ